MKIEGGCHCGNIRYTFFWPGGDAEIPVRACSCDFCMKHAATYTSHPEGRLRAQVRDAEMLSRYRFGHETADFFVCGRCGVIPFATCEIDECLHAVVNIHTFEGVDPTRMVRRVTDFEGETPTQRLARRHQRWTADVRVSGVDGASDGPTTRES